MKLKFKKPRQKWWRLVHGTSKRELYYNVTSFLDSICNGENKIWLEVSEHPMYGYDGRIALLLTGSGFRVVYEIVATKETLNFCLGTFKKYFPNVPSILYYKQVKSPWKVWYKYV